MELDGIQVVLLLVGASAFTIVMFFLMDRFKNEYGETKGVASLLAFPAIAGLGFTAILMLISLLFHTNELCISLVIIPIVGFFLGALILKKKRQFIIGFI
jgi:hypothetical protein